MDWRFDRPPGMWLYRSPLEMTDRTEVKFSTQRRAPDPGRA
jgi:hypothetical protein